MDVSCGYQIFIVGKCGSGKSSVANTLLGKSVFKTGLSASSVTRSSQEDSAEYCGRSINVVDTAGLNSKFFKTPSLLEAPGPRAVLLTISASERFTTELFSSIEQFAKLVGKEVYNYTVIALTHGDELINNSITIDQFKKSAPRSFRTLVKRCGDRLIQIDNTATEDKKRETVNRVLTAIDTIKSERKEKTTRNLKFSNQNSRSIKMHEWNLIPIYM